MLSRRTNKSLGKLTNLVFAYEINSLLLPPRLKGTRKLSFATQSMAQYTVDVAGRHYAVKVYQHAHKVWIAAGKFLGDRLRTSGSTARKAVRAWQKAAVDRHRDTLEFNSTRP